MTLPVITGDGGGIPYAVERYDGIDPQYLDLEFFYAWAQFCSVAILDGDGGTEPRCAFNSIIDETTDTFSLVHKIAAVGRANTYWKGHQLTGWIDNIVATPIDLVTMDSMMNKTWKNAWSIKKELAGIVEIFYKDKKQGYERTSAELGDSNAGSLDNSISLDGLGITSHGVAIHYANHLLERNRLILNTNRFKVHKDGFRYKLGKTIRLQSKPANWGKAFRVVSSTANTITVDRVAITEVNAGDVLHIRSYDTVLEVIVTDTYEVDSVVGKVITATISWNVTPIKGNIVAIGTAGDVKLRRIVKLTPTVDNYFNVEVETYDVDLYNADDINPDNPNVNYVWPKSIVDVNAPLTKSQIEDLIAQALPPQPDIEIPHLTNCVWTSEAPGAIKWAARDAAEPIEFRFRGTTYEIALGNFTDEFAYWDPDYTSQFRTTSIASVALAPGHWLMATVKDNTVYPANAQQLTHAAILQAGTITAAYGQIAALTVGTAEIIDLNVTTLKIKDNAVTLMVAAYTAGQLSYGDTVWHEAQTITIETIGQPVVLSFSIQWFGDHFDGMDIRVQRDGSDVYLTHMSFLASYGNPFSVSIVDEPGSGEYVYDLDIRCTPVSGAKELSFRHRSLIAKEIKK